MLKAFLISFIISTGLFLTLGNIHQSKTSLDRSEQILRDIKKQAEHLEIIKTYYNF